MNIFLAYKLCLQKYAVFSGRSRRSEFWGFALVNYLISALLLVLSWPLAALSYEAVGLGYILMLIYSLAVFIPGLAVSVRRLHDIDRSGAYLLMGLIPVAGFIILLVAFCTESSLGENRYGPSPKGRYAQAGVKVSPVAAPKVDVQVNVKAVPELPRTTVEPSMDSRILICLSGELKGQRYKLNPGDTVVIGRDFHQCNVAFPTNTPGVSKVHCKISFDGKAATITDLSSTYGTFVKGERLEAGVPMLLHRGLPIELGGKSIRFTLN